jgi:ABC-type Fe3+-hydroxamate transport system substrate-binding protein
MTSPDFETMIGLRPDLIVMTTAGNDRKDFEKLTSLGLNVFVSNPKTLEDIYRSILTLGRLCGRVNESSEVVDRMKYRQDIAVRKAGSAQPQTVLLLFSLRPLVSAGKGTFVDELLTAGNLRNVTHDSPTSYPLLSREEVVSRQPDWIIVSDDVVQSAGDIVASYPEWKSLRAVQKGQIALIGASLISRPGPRIIEGLEALVAMTHP